ncbi:MAG: non-canonical purine NTP pyrophosphatase [SAR324 cluster bacterium]|nr:non-canonical purine NTP pyrophosphatase [SAR324 cluster bacterium]
MNTRIYFVSSNSKKYSEFKEMINFPIEIIDIDLEEIQTSDMDKLLKHKVRQAYYAVKAPVIVEDTALYFNAWNRLPGPLIKWFLKELGVNQLVQALSSFKDKSARAVCSIGYMDGDVIRVFDGMIEGKIVTPSGNYGFGWDCIFQPEGSTLTFAEMRPGEKNRFSMRQKALEEFNFFLKGFSI